VSIAEWRDRLAVKLKCVSCSWLQSSADANLNRNRIRPHTAFGHCHPVPPPPREGWVMTLATQDGDALKPGVQLGVPD